MSHRVNTAMIKTDTVYPKRERILALSCPPAQAEKDITTSGSSPWSILDSVSLGVSLLILVTIT
jgi:hypothetical protein